VKYAIHADDGEVSVFPLDNLEVIEVDDRELLEFEALVDDNASLAELRAFEVKRLKPDFRDGVEHVYDVKISVAVGIVFDHEPTEEELRTALAENFAEKFWYGGVNDLDLDDDIEYELLEVSDTMEGNE
jgi:hypothetical protein